MCGVALLRVACFWKHAVKSGKGALKVLVTGGASSAQAPAKILLYSNYYVGQDQFLQGACSVLKTEAAIHVSVKMVCNYCLHDISCTAEVDSNALLLVDVCSWLPTFSRDLCGPRLLTRWEGYDLSFGESPTWVSVCTQLCACMQPE